MVSSAHALGAEVLAFLAEQRLAPTPRNYMLGYIVRTGIQTPAGQAVSNITDGGVRITEGQAEEIFDRYLGSVAAGSGGLEEEPERAAVRRQALRLAEIADDTAAATGAFNRDVGAGLSQLGDLDVKLAAIVSSMLERTAAAEGRLAASGAELQKVREELEAARGDATRDALTGLPNRRAIDARLAELEALGQSRSIAIVDVDRFKSVNDRYGHGVGDRVLRTVSAALSESCAPHLVGRWGGEEFVVILPSVDLREATDILDRARVLLGSRQFKVRETDEPMGSITFSAGVVQALGGFSSTSAALEAADGLLYRAKAEGRNRVLSALASSLAA